MNDSLARLTLPVPTVEAPAAPARVAGHHAGPGRGFWQRVPLRHWLTLPYVALVLGVALVVGALSYFTGSRAVDTLTDKLLLETADRIGQAVDRHVLGSSAALEAAFPDGLPAPTSLEAELASLRSRFWIATSLHLDPNNYVYFGNRVGQFFGLWRHSMTEGELRLKLKADEPRSFQRFVGLDGAITETSKESSLYDPRLRPWYRAGQTHSSHAWTSIYIDYRTSELVATRARRVLDARGEFAGVVATDLSLRALNDFVRQLRLTPNAVALIIERDGQLIASSRSPNVERNTGGDNVRINIANSHDALERAAFAAVKAAGAALAPGAGTLRFTGPQGEDSVMALTQVKDAVGLDWIVAVAVPRSDLMGGIPANVLRTALIAAAAALLAAWLGLRILRWIARDLTQLTQAVRAVGAGGAEVPIAIQRQDEIGELADCFRQMQHRLRTDHLTGLVNRETLCKRVDERIHQHRRAADTHSFALLFIDLDDFKLVNDCWGHDAGDRVLVEIGKRLRANTRSTDWVARYAGDEFVVLLDRVDNNEMAEQLRDKIDQVLRQPITESSAGHVATQIATRVPISGSVGLAVFASADADADAQTMIKRADADMYRRKSAGKAK